MGIEEGNRRPLRKMLRPVQKRVVAPYRLGFHELSDAVGPEGSNWKLTWPSAFAPLILFGWVIIS